MYFKKKTFYQNSLHTMYMVMFKTWLKKRFRKNICFTIRGKGKTELHVQFC